MPIPLRPDFDATQLRVEARQAKHAGQARQLLALAAVYERAAHTEAAKIGGVILQIVRDWAVNFNAFGPEGLIDRKAADSVDPDQPIRPIVITCHGDQTRAVHHARGGVADDFVWRLVASTDG